MKLATLPSNRGPKIRQLANVVWFVLLFCPLIQAQPADPLHATTVAQYLQMTLGQQRAAVEEIVNALRQSVREGLAKATENQVARRRERANFMIACFDVDPQAAKETPPGYIIINLAVKQASSASHSSDKLFDVAYVALEDLFEDSTKPWLAGKDGEYQMSYYRLEATKDAVKRATDAALKDAKNDKAAADKDLRDLYDYKSIVLPDGRHVLSNKKGDFFVITRNGGPLKGPITGPAKAQAEKIEICISSLGRAKCGQPVAP